MELIFCGLDYTGYHDNFLFFFIFYFFYNLPKTYTKRWLHKESVTQQQKAHWAEAQLLNLLAEVDLGLNH